MAKTSKPSTQVDPSITRARDTAGRLAGRLSAALAHLQLLRDTHANGGFDDRTSHEQVLAGLSLLHTWLATQVTAAEALHTTLRTVVQGSGLPGSSDDGAAAPGKPTLTVVREGDPR